MTSRLRDEQILKLLDLCDNEGMTIARAGRRCRMTKNAAIGLLYRIRIESALVPDFCEKPENRDGGMPRNWWKGEPK